jgi:DNA-binding Xre family transcriptional regulator
MVAMKQRIKQRPRDRQTFLLMKASSRKRQAKPAPSRVVSSIADLRNSLAQATNDSLWISYERHLTEALLKYVSWPTRSLGDAVLIHALTPQTLAALSNCFQRLAFSGNDGFLPFDELTAALRATNSSDLFIGGNIDHSSQTITLWRANLESLTVPFSAFAKSGDGTTPDFAKFSIVDCGQTIRLGHYEASADAILYEFDSKYRRRISKQRQQSEQSFGASLRRLRKQRGLRREDFGPDLAAKTIARIEQGKVKRIQSKTLDALAEKLHVKANDIATF